MASSLDQFLRKSTKEKKTKTIPVTLSGGENLEIDIRELTAGELKRIRNKNTKTYPPVEGSAQAVTGLDDLGFSGDIVLAGVVEPNLQSAKLIASYGVTNKEDLLWEMFTLQEVGRIASEIVQLTQENTDNTPTTNGTEPKLVNEAKN